MSENPIASTPLFAALPPDEIQYLSGVLRQTSYPAGSILFREGDPGDRFSVITAGQVEIVKALDTPDERPLALLNPGEFIGEMSLFYRGRKRSASARALTPVQLLELTRADFDALLQRRPELALAIMQAMSERLRNSENATIRDLQEKNRQLAQAFHQLQDAQAQLIEKEKMAHELNMARRIQASILPREIPSLDGWQLAAHWQPARAVSGDFYDFIPFPNGEWGLVIGDVTDKGVPAALVMATTRSVIRSTAASAAVLNPPTGDAAGRRVSPGEILARANDLLCPDMPPGMFVTCFFAILDPAFGRLRFANAGHCLPGCRTRNGVVDLHATGMPLGCLPGMAYEEKEITLEDGDLILFYSDGIVEAHNRQREMFGMPRLREHLARRTAPETTIEHMLGLLANFTGPDWEQEDDVTLMTLQKANPSL